METNIEDPDPFMSSYVSGQIQIQDDAEPGDVIHNVNVLRARCSL
jgi:hypothetical protein